LIMTQEVSLIMTQEVSLIMKRKFKQWWLPIPQISIKRTTTFNQLNLLGHNQTNLLGHNQTNLLGHCVLTVVCHFL
jgi:hypothetical protein